MGRVVERRSACAGSFYPDSPAEIAAFIKKAAAHRHKPSLGAGLAPVAGLLPHAGWYFSGPIALQVIQAMATENPVTVVVFGPSHRVYLDRAALYIGDSWQLPGGSIAVDRPLGQKLLGNGLGGWVVGDNIPHANEHAIEVQLPFVRHFMPNALILPIAMPAIPEATELGRQIARLAGRQVLYLASSDLTHYGPNYHFAPHGRGADGLKWALEQNDRQLLELALQGRGSEVVEHALSAQSACGGGAIAALLGALQVARPEARGQLLAHTTSCQERPEHGTDNSVGYAGIVW